MRDPQFFRLLICDICSDFFKPSFRFNAVLEACRQARPLLYFIAYITIIMAIPVIAAWHNKVEENAQPIIVRIHGKNFFRSQDGLIPLERNDQ